MSSFYSHGKDNDKKVWFGKYLRDNEEKICLNCVKNRKGFRKEFKSLIGVSVNELEKKDIVDKEKFCLLEEGNEKSNLKPLKTRELIKVLQILSKLGLIGKIEKKE